MLQTLRGNADTSRRVAASILDDLHRAVATSATQREKEGGEGKQDEVLDLLSEERGSMAFSIMPRSGEQKVEDVRKLAYVLPEYFKPATVAN